MDIEGYRKMNYIYIREDVDIIEGMNKVEVKMACINSTWDKLHRQRRPANGAHVSTRDMYIHLVYYIRSRYI